MKKEESIVLSKGFYWIEQEKYRWISNEAEIVILDNKKYDFIYLKLNSCEQRKCSIFLKKTNQDFEKFDELFINKKNKVRIPLENLEKIKLENDYFIPPNGDNRKLSLLFEGIDLEKANTTFLLNIHQLRTGLDFGHEKTLGMEFSSDEARDKVYEKIGCLPHNFDWEDYAFKNGNKRIKSKAQAIEYFLAGRRLIPPNQVPEKTLLVSTLLFIPDERSEEFLKKSILQLNKELKNEINLVFVIRNNSCGEGSKEIKSILSQLSSEGLDIIYTEGENLGYGKGHNKNFEECPSDYFLILNDDLEFLHFEWIKEAIFLFEDNQNLAFIGSDDSPKYINNLGFGKINGSKEPDYVEGSILMTRSDIFSKFKFDENIEYFYFEDVDLSLRAKQKGYNIDFIKIPHQHYRSNSAKKLNQEAMCAVNELNRSKFLSKWSNYLNNKKPLNNSAVILLESDGFGDLADCYYPVVELVKRNRDKDLTLLVSNKKMNFLFENLKVKIENNKYALSIKDYDQVYGIKDVNFSPPIHTLDLIAAKLGIDDFSTDEAEIKSSIAALDFSEDVKKLPSFSDLLSNYCVLHLDSQRKSFEGRQPELKTFIHSIDVLPFDYLFLIGEHSVKDLDNEYEEYIKQNKKIIDLRTIVTIQDMAILIANAKMFFGIDSGPSHLAQLFNTPSFILYGPIHPLTKMYRYNNGGTYYKNDKSCGLYHRFLEPSYYYDIERTIKCMEIDSIGLSNKLMDFVKNNFKFDWTQHFDSLRLRQREWSMLQMNNPLFRNRLFLNQGQNTKEYVDDLIRRS